MAREREVRSEVLNEEVLGWQGRGCGLICPQLPLLGDDSDRVLKEPML